jgi:hypothetical protein
MINEPRGGTGFGDIFWLLHAGFGQKFDAMLMCFLCVQDVFTTVLVFPIC